MHHSPRHLIRRIVTLTLSIGVVVLTAGASVALATLTITSSTITSDQSLNLTGAGTSTFDFGSNTLQLHTTNNGPITTGNGLLTVPGTMTIGTSTLVANSMLTI